MDDLSLVFPTKEHESRAFQYIKEFRDHDADTNGTGGLDRFDNYKDWLVKLVQDLDIPNIPKGRVPAHTYFLIRKSDTKIIGMINIRHRLNDFLLNEGGHIGYSIRPSEFGKGYGNVILSLGLQKCRQLGLLRVLIICDKVNTASAKIIQNNGGVLEDERYSEFYSEVIQRYWITL